MTQFRHDMQRWEYEFNNWEYAPLVGLGILALVSSLLISAGVYSIRNKKASEGPWKVEGRKAVIAGWYRLVCGIGGLLTALVWGLIEVLK